VTEEERVRAYTRAVGHPPENRPDDPDWNYRGSKREEEALRKSMNLPASDAPEMIPGQMELA
jgi:hypothetical protein